MSSLPLKHHLRRAHGHIRDHVIPHHGNGHHPHALKHHVLFGYSIILVLLKVLVVVTPIALPSSSLYSSAITAKNIIELTNQARENLQLNSLAANSVLAQAAQAKANDMLEHQYFAHTSPAGVTPWEWFKRVGYAYRNAGENLAVHFHEAEDVQAGWMASLSHRANILNGKYREIGVGVATGSFEGAASTFVVQLFGTRRGSDEGGALVSAPAQGQQTTAVMQNGEVAGVNAGEGEVASQGFIQKIVQPPVIDESTFVAVPKKEAGAWEVGVEVAHASRVEVVLGDRRVALSRRGESSLWQGTVSLDPLSDFTSGTSLTVIASNEETPAVTATLALIAPDTTTQKLYIVSEGTDRYTSVLRFFNIKNVNDVVHRFYVTFIIGLSTLLLLSLLAVRLKIHHPLVVSHAVAVLCLGVLLSVL
jgi:hypothetical protein